LLPLKALTMEEFEAGLLVFKFFDFNNFFIIQILLPGEWLIPAEGGLFRFKFPARKQEANDEDE
jgi:hypothetical protein